MTRKTRRTNRPEPEEMPVVLPHAVISVTEKPASNANDSDG